MTEQCSGVTESTLRVSAFEALPSEVAILDEEGVILETNGSWESFGVANGVSVEEMARVDADDGLLTQLLENLFRNAVENAGDDARITVGPLDGGAGFYVAYDGPGVPPDRLDDVFDLGYTTNKDDGGTGLGLAIVDRIAEGHGWDVRVTESETGGARFEVSGVTSQS